MNTHDTYYPDLITRYLSGEATQEEITELSGWIASDREHAALFDELRKAWFAVSASQVEGQIDLDSEWEQMMPKLSGFGDPRSERHDLRSPKHDPRSVIRDPRFAMHNARPENQPGPGQIPDPKSGIAHPASGIRHPASGIRHQESGKAPRVVRMESDRLPWQVVLIRASLIAAIALVLMIPVWVGYRYFTRTDVVRITASGEVMEALLPDGSTVSLSAYSSLTYSEDFGKKNRDIVLIGEGYFEAKRDSLMPFILSSGASRLEVLGTSFYVDASKDAGNISVVLVEGSVALYFDEARSTGKTIIPGEKAEMTQATQRIVVVPNEDPNFLAWKTHNLIFLDDRLDMIINTLNKVYQSNISLADERMAGCRLTASFNQQELGSVLSVIEATLDLRAETTSSAIILYGRGCN